MSRYLFSGEYVGTPAQQEVEPLVACAMIASNVPLTPPARWFDNPRLAKSTPLTVEDDGRVFGHLAAWDTPHIGLPFNTRPPRSRSRYAYFHSGVLRTQEGTDIPVGQLTLVGGHANLALSANDAVKHYDDTDSAVADVHLGEDAFGIWIAGALRPGIKPEQVRVLRASPLSGDWRPIRGRLELVAACAVNVPGFPIARTMVASGYVTALVAAGAAAIAQLHGPSLDERLDRIENALSAAIPAPKVELTPEQQARFAAIAAEAAARTEALAASARARVQEIALEGDEATVFKDVSTEKRQELAKKGHALPDGSYPIVSQADVARAIRAYGRAKPEDKAKVRRHIIRRARGLGRADSIPKSWLSVSVDERHADAAAAFRELVSRDLLVDHADLTARVAALKFTGGKDKRFEDKLHPRDDMGQFRDVLARFKRENADTPGLSQAIAEAEEAQQSAANGKDQETDQHLSKVIQIVDQVASDTRDPNAAKTLRDGYRELGRFVSGIDLPPAIDASKMRYSDLSPTVQGTIEDLLARLEKTVSPDTFREVTADIMDFKRGGDVWNQAELQAALTKVTRFLLGTDKNNAERAAQERLDKINKTNDAVVE